MRRELMLKRNQIFENEEGNLVVILQVVLCLMFGALSISGYLSLGLQNLKYISLKQKTHSHTERIFAKIRDSIASNDDSCAPFSALKDASLPPPTSPGSASSSLIQFNSPLSLVPCFIETKEEASLYKNFSLTIDRVFRDNDKDIISTQIEVRLKFATDTAPSVASELQRRLTTTLVSSANFAAIFRGSNKVIEIDTKASLVISGKTLAAHETSDLGLGSYVSPTLLSSKPPDIFFQGPLFATGQAIQFNSAFGVEDLLTRFYGGFQLDASNGLSAFPFSSSGPEWNQPFDYYWVYQGISGAPLPVSVPGAATGPGFQEIDIARAQVTSFPDGTILNSLNVTCASSSPHLGSIPQMVILAKSKPVDLNFSASSIFCGLIMADTLTVRLSHGKEVAIYGHINVRKLQIVGEGKLYILNPFDFVTMPNSAVLPVDMSVQQLAGNFMSLKATLAHNFFVPFGDSVPSDFGVETVPKYFQDCGANKCWALHIQSPENSLLFGSSPDWYKKMKFLVAETL